MHSSSSTGGLKALPDSANAHFPEAIIQTCLIPGTFRYASKKYSDQISRDLKPIDTAPSPDAAWNAFEEFEEKCGKPYPAISTLWPDAWEHFIPFLDYDGQIRKVLCSTNAIESLNARYRRAVTAKGHFPQRAVGVEDPLLGYPIPGPQRHRASKMDNALEACFERSRRHLR